MDTEWNADLYLRFERERTQPSIDLINRINIDNPKTIVDIGCGPGNSTAVLRERWQFAEIVGVDHSEQMIQKATENYPEGKWILSDALSFDEEEGFDIVFSNAAIQWIKNHETLLPHLLSLLKPNGVIAIQVPQNQESPIHCALMETAADDPFYEFTGEAKKALNYRTGLYYYNLLSGVVNDLYIWETTYYHVLGSHQDLLSWYKSTGMRPFLKCLPTDELRRQLLDKVLEKCRESYEQQPDGNVLFPFKRLFLLGYL